ncbi:DUF7660 family protein [Sporocytophaga myxococcoides]|uniref:DUF7660 family protein n=1 Tax=Sporocytophaga myxococcoides TaxID=153721 RepID=UPI000417F025|nr:hypothetical protein [Sporocytophaga myxococcoides]
MELLDKIKKIESREDFLEFVRKLKLKLETGELSLENDKIPDYLEGIMGVSMGIDGMYKNNKIEKEMEFPSWRAFAIILYSATSHS